MSTDLNVNFDDDEDDIVSNPSTPIPSTPNGMFDFFSVLPTSDKKRDKELKQDQAKRTREQRAEQARLRKEFAASTAEALRQQRQESAKDRAASRTRARDIRQDNAQGNVQLYGLSSLLGLPGYVASSIAGKMLYGDTSDQNAKAEEKYQKELTEYNYRKQEEARANKANYEKQLQNVPVTATDITKKSPLVDMFGKPLQQKQAPLNKPTPQPPGPAQPNFVGPPPKSAPPLLPPTAPTAAPNPGLDAIGSAGNIIAYATLAAQLVNNKVSEAHQQATSVVTSLLNGSAESGLSKASSSFQGLVDPLGVNAPLNVAVEGFNSLLSINESIRNSILSNVGIAPQTIGASIEGDLAKLMNDIDISFRLDPVTSQLIRANNKLDLAWADLRASFLEVYGPMIAQMVEKLAKILEGTATYGPAIRELAGVTITSMSPTLHIIQLILSKIFGKMDEEDIEGMADKEILQQIDRFMNPTESLAGFPGEGIPFPNP